MAIVPVRALASKGILKDPSPYELDLDAWSGGVNVIFQDGKVERAPVWRSVIDPLPSQPIFTSSYRSALGFDTVLVACANGRLFNALSGVTSEVTPTGFTQQTSYRAWNSTQCAGVNYINRPTDVPYFFGPSSSIYAPQPSWDSTWTCRSLRSFQDYMIALNVTKAGVQYPNMVKWSDNVLQGLPPGSWDSTDPDTNAGENPLADLDSQIVDGAALKSIFVVYSETQVWAMEAVTGNDVFDFYRIFSEGGLIAPNCVVEVEGLHYVFGVNDIYRHDGVTKQSLADQRVRKYIFRNLNTQMTEGCFAIFMPDLKGVMFGYASGDPDVVYSQTAGYCNRGAFYSIPGDTWTFVDLPNIGCPTLTNLYSQLTWATVGDDRTWFNTGGSWWDQSSGFDLHTVAPSAALSGKVTSDRLIAYDFMNKGTLAFPYLAELNPTPYVERTGLDLSQLGGQIQQYKRVRRMFPLVNSFGINSPLSIKWGGAEAPTATPNWGPSLTFDPSTQYKIDASKGGRFLAFNFSMPFPADFEFAGFDLDIVPVGTR